MHWRTHRFRTSFGALRFAVPLPGRKGNGSGEKWSRKYAGVDPGDLIQMSRNACLRSLTKIKTMNYTNKSVVFKGGLPVAVVSNVLSAVLGAVADNKSEEKGASE